MKLVCILSGDQSSSQTPLETPSLCTVAAFSSRFLRSDRNIRTLLLLVSCDMTSVERTFSCQTVKRLKALSPLTFSWSIMLKEEGLLPFRQPLAGHQVSLAKKAPGSCQGLLQNGSSSVPESNPVKKPVSSPGLQCG